MSAFSKCKVRPASVVSVASPVALVASQSPRSVIARALLRARKDRQANVSKRIAERRACEVTSRVPGFVPRVASVPGREASCRLH